MAIGFTYITYMMYGVMLAGTSLREASGDLGEYYDTINGTIPESGYKYDDCADRECDFGLYNSAQVCKNIIFVLTIDLTLLSNVLLYVHAYCLGYGIGVSLVTTHFCWLLGCNFVICNCESCWSSSCFTGEHYKEFFEDLEVNYLLTLYIFEIFFSRLWLKTRSTH